MKKAPLGTWLGRLRAAATVVYIVALCLAVAVLVIGFIPGSPVSLELPTASLSGLDGIRGVEPGVVVDPSGGIVFKIVDASLPQRLLYVATMVPGLILIADIARRMAKLLRTAQESDPFAAGTARELTTVAKITAFGGLGVWAASILAKWGLSATMLHSGAAIHPDQSLLGWLAVGLIFAGFGQLIAHGVAMRTELDTVI